MQLRIIIWGGGVPLRRRGREEWKQGSQEMMPAIMWGKTKGTAPRALLLSPLMHSGAFTKVYVGWNGNSTGASQSLGPELTLRTK